MFWSLTNTTEATIVQNMNEIVDLVVWIMAICGGMAENLSRSIPNYETRFVPGQPLN